MEAQACLQVYKELELSLRIKPRKRLIREKPEALTVPLEINQVWSMDFMHDQLEDGRKFRLFNVIDDYNREAIGMEAGFSLPAKRVIQRAEADNFLARKATGNSLRQRAGIHQCCHSELGCRMGNQA